MLLSTSVTHSPAAPVPFFLSSGYYHILNSSVHDLLLKKRTATCRICLLSSSREAGQLQCSEPKKTADISRHHHWFPREMTSEDMSASAIITPLYWSILCMWCMCNVLTSAQNCPKKAKSSWLTKPLSTKTSPLATAVPPGVILFFFCLIKKLII